MSFPGFEYLSHILDERTEWSILSPSYAMCGMEDEQTSYSVKGVGRDNTNNNNCTNLPHKVESQ